MFKLDAFGKGPFGTIIAIQGNEACWSDRVIAVYAAAPPELAGQDKAMPVNTWAMQLAGLGTLDDLSGLNWRPAPDHTSWNVIGEACKDLETFIKAARKIISASSPRNYGTVVCIDKDGAAATDGFRLIFGSVGIKSEKPICLPFSSLKALETVYKAIGRLGEQATVSVSEDMTMLAVVSASVKLFVRLSAITYPNYRGVLPQPSELQDYIAPETIAALKKTAEIQKKAAKPSVPLTSDILGNSFNARFVLDMPETLNYRLTKSGEILLASGAISTVLVGIKKPEEEAVKKRA